MTIQRQPREMTSILFEFRALISGIDGEMGAGPKSLPSGNGPSRAPTVESDISSIEILIKKLEECVLSPDVPEEYRDQLASIAAKSRSTSADERREAITEVWDLTIQVEGRALDRFTMRMEEIENEPPTDGVDREIARLRDRMATHLKLYNNCYPTPPTWVRYYGNHDADFMPQVTHILCMRKEAFQGLANAVEQSARRVGESLAVQMVKHGIEPLPVLKYFEAWSFDGDDAWQREFNLALNRLRIAVAATSPTSSTQLMPSGPARREALGELIELQEVHANVGAECHSPLLQMSRSLDYISRSLAGIRLWAEEMVEEVRPHRVFDDEEQSWVLTASGSEILNRYHHSIRPILRAVDGEIMRVDSLAPTLFKALQHAHPRPAQLLTKIRMSVFEIWNWHQGDLPPGMMMNNGIGPHTYDPDFNENPHLLCAEIERRFAGRLRTWSWWFRSVVAPSLPSAGESETEASTLQFEPSTGRAPRRELSPTAKLVLDIMKSLPAGKKLTGTEIIKLLEKRHGKVIEQSTLTKHIVPPLRQFGLTNDGGYFLAPTDRERV